MIKNIEALKELLAYIDSSEATHFSESGGGWNHVYLHALIVDEQSGAKAMKQPVGAWIESGGEPTYISMGTHDENNIIDPVSGRHDGEIQLYTDGIAGFQDLLRNGIDGVEVIFTEFDYE